MTQHVAAKGDKRFKVGICIIGLVDQGIFKGWTPVCLLRVGDKSLAQLLESLVFHARHDLVTGLLNRAMQAYGQGELLGFLCKTQDAFCDTAG